MTSHNICRREGEWVEIITDVEREIDLRKRTLPLDPSYMPTIVFPYCAEGLLGPHQMVEMDVLGMSNVTHSPAENIWEDKDNKVRYMRRIKTILTWSILWPKGLARPKVGP